MRTAVLCVFLATITGLLTVKLGSLQHQLKALVIVVAALAMIVAALRAEYGLTILITLIPFEFGFYGTNSDTVLMYSLALVMAWRIRFAAIPLWTSVGATALVLGAFIASFGAHNKSIAFEDAVNWLAAVLLMYTAFSVLRRRRDASRRMIDIFTGSSLVVVLFAFLQKAGINAIVGPPFQRGLPNSFFGYYTVYAGYVAMAATLATGELLIAVDRREAKRIGLYGVSLVILLSGLTVSTSRGGIVALATGWLLLFTLNLRRGPVLARAAVLLAVFAAAGYVATPPSTIATIEHRIALSNGSQGEDKERFALHAAGERALVSHPLGLGYGNFSYYLRVNVHGANIHMPFFHSHETPVQIGLDTGWLGLTGFLTLFACPLLVVFFSRARGNAAVRASAFAAALGGLMAQGLYDYLFYALAFPVFYLALVWGTVHALSSDPDELSTASSSARVSAPTATNPSR